MSSGPSWRNENPRPASSIWGRRDAEIEEDAVDPFPAAARRFVAEHGEAFVDDRETRVVDRAGRGDRVGVAIEREEASVGGQPFEHQPAVAAPPERAVDVATAPPFGLDREPVDGGVEQHRPVPGR